MEARAAVAAQATTTSVYRIETEDYATALVRCGNGAPGAIAADRDPPVPGEDALASQRLIANTSSTAA